MKIYGVIMAGGGGTRFWPLSRKKTPKQLLNLSGREVMINETIDRVSKIAESEDIFIVTNAAQAEAMRKVTAGRVPSENILCEPSARNTAACIGYAAVKIIKERGDGVMVVTPSDAYIRDSEKYAEILRTAANHAANANDIVTIGVAPTFPATGYGYIRYKDGGSDINEVLSFVEKPDRATAEEYLKAGGYVWNSGVFVWKASVILEKFKEFLPDVYSGLMKISSAVKTGNEQKVLNEVYPQIRSISVDYGIMEKSDGIKVICGDFGWNDVGSWDMLGVLHECDENGNVVAGDTLLVDTKDSVVYSSGRLVAAVGVDNLVVVETPDAVLVLPKDRAQDVKKIVEKLAEQKREELL